MAEHGRAVRRVRRTLALAALAGTLVPAQAGAHPHVWIEAGVELLGDGTGRIAALGVTWSFDEFYTAFTVLDLPKDEAGKVRAEALRAVAADMIKNLRDWGYFTELEARSGGAGFGKVATGEVADFTVELAGERLRIRFDLPLGDPVGVLAGEFRVRMFDPTYYVAIELPESSAVEFSPDIAESCRAELIEPDLAGTTLSLSEAELAEQADASRIGAMFAQTVAVACR